MDFFNTIGSLGLGSRLKRLSDLFMAETRAIYSAAGVEFEPRWFPVFFLLQERGEITVMEATAVIGVPHTYISQIIKEMRQVKLVRLKRHPDDGRSRFVTLTSKGQALSNVLQPLWGDIQDAVDTIIQGTGVDVLGIIRQMEQLMLDTPTSKLVQTQWRSRVKQQVTSDIIRISRDTVYIRAIEPTDNLQVATIIRSVMTEVGASGPGFSIHDTEVSQMFEAYSTPRSQYFVALYNDEIVGGCGVAALAQGDPDICELRKMYVLPRGRGLGIGRALLERSLRVAASLGYIRCYLETLNSMQAAQRLYEHAGFIRIPGPLGNTGHFSCDAFYVKEISPSLALGMPETHNW